jgi:hypothetical protein
MASGVWVTCGAPLETGDGWRVWYSWPDGDFTPAKPRVRTPGGIEQEVVEGDWQPGQPPPGSTRRMAIRELRIADPDPGALYEVTIPELGRPVFWRTLPTELPQDGVSLLIGSCFWLNDDKEGFYSSAVKELVQREKPIFKVLMGDQLYVDVWAPLPGGMPQNLAAKYERYWGDDPYRELLAACPTLVSCDDHEFWNDYPEPQIHVPLSWERHANAAGTALAGLYDAYQSALNPGAKRWCTLELPPISFFIADTRSHRTRDSAPRPALMLDDQWDALEAWSAGLQGPGVLVLPQPLLKGGGSKTDRTLVDFEQSDRLGRVFEDTPHDILILTGDIHTGRLSRAEIVGRPGAIYEFVASPASMVTPWLPPWGHEPSKLPERLVINHRKWVITAHRRLTSTVDNNVGLIKIAPGRNGRYRFTLQLWRVREYKSLGKRIFGRKPARGAQAIHDPIEIELK